MNLASLKLAPAMTVLAVATIALPYAHAGCGLYNPRDLGKYQPQIDLQQFEPSALAANEADADRDDDAPAHSIVGTWKEHWISVGSKGIPDGTEIDAGYSQWHTDGTEENISGLRAPMTGDVCFGEWVETGKHTYRMNHVGISYDSTGQNLIGPAHIQQWLTLGTKGQATVGRFTIDQYDEDGNLLAHLQGGILGTRFTMETGYQKVE